MAEFLSLSAAEYHARPELSRSQLETLITEGPVAFRAELDGDTEREVTDAMEVGTILHAMLLEDADLYSIVAIEKNLKTRQSKAWSEFEWAARNVGQIPLLEKQVEPIWESFHAMRRNPGWQTQIAGTQREQSLIWRDERTGLDLRCRFDAVDETTVVDLKTTKVACDERSLADHIARFGYHRQAAFYSKGYLAYYGRLPSFVFAFVQVVEPYETALIQLSPSFLARGMAEVDEALADLAARIATGNWQRTTYGQVVQVDEPRWLKYAHEYTI